MKLISMTDFVLEQKEILATDEIDLGTYLLRIFKYAKFLKQPLTIGQFIPALFVDGERKILEKPSFITHGNDIQDLRDEYQLSKERVIFEGFVYEKETNSVYNENGQCRIFINLMENYIVENLLSMANGNLTLTSNAKIR